jgi:hypothetical protein
MKSVGGDPRLRESDFFAELESAFAERFGQTWRLLTNVQIGRSEVDLVATDDTGNAFLLEVKWGVQNRPIHLGALAQLESLGPEGVESEPKDWPVDFWRHVADPNSGRDWHLRRVTQMLATNMRVSDQSADLARRLDVKIVSEATDDPQKLAVAVVEELADAVGAQPVEVPQQVPHSEEMA